jgi:hypothetical protein
MDGAVAGVERCPRAGSRNGMTTLDYHKLRIEEKKTWNPALLEAGARKRDSTFPEKIASLLPGPKDWLTAKISSVTLSPVAAKLIELCELYLAGTPDERVFMRSRIDLASGKAFMGLGVRQAVVGMREKSEYAIRLGVIAHAIDDLASGDARDTLVRLTLLWHAAKRIGADANAVFLAVAAIAGPAFSALLEDWVKRHPSLQSLACMGWQEVETPEGPDFRGWGRR